MNKTYTNFSANQRKLHILSTLLACCFAVGAFYFGIDLIYPFFNQQPVHNFEIESLSALTANSGNLAQDNVAQPLECGPLYQEAENGMVDGWFTVGTSPHASAGSFVYVPQGKGDIFTSPLHSQRVRFCVNISNSGNYFLKATTLAQGVANNSFYIQIDNEPSSGIIWHVPPSGEFVAHDVTANSTSSPLIFFMDVGIHYVDFFLREDDTRLDNVEIVPALSSASTTMEPANKRFTQTTDGIAGYVTADYGDPWLQYNVTPKFANVTISIKDAATNGERFSNTMPTDEQGYFLFDELLPSEYLVEAELPQEHLSLGPESIRVDLAPYERHTVSFDLLVLDALPELFEEDVVNNFDSTGDDPNISNGSGIDDGTGTESKIYLPVTNR